MTIPARPHQVESRPLSSGANRHNLTPSISSELTITPARYRSQSPQNRAEDATAKDTVASTSQLAGLVGMFTGLGALVALLIFLPLPAQFQKGGTTASDSVAQSFWVVGAVAIVVAFICFVGLRNLPGEENKGWRKLFGKERDDDKFLLQSGEEESKPTISYMASLRVSFLLGFKDVNIGLGYLGGFVARASSVAISLFIPLFVNAYFISSGICNPDPNDPSTPSDPGEIKRRCARAYVVAAKLTGTSQLVALVCAPIFGYLSGRYKRFNIPLILATFAGIAGYTAFGLLKSPDPASKDGSAGVYFIVALLGISQIGAIVCSLGQLGRGIQGELVAEEADAEEADNDTVRSVNGGLSNVPVPVQRAMNSNGTPVSSRRDSGAARNEYSPLLPSHLRQINPPPNSSRAQLKGSIAGIYSLGGGAGILLLTKAGGLMFDRLDVGAPFWIMAASNAILFFAAITCALVEWARLGRAESNDHPAADVNGDVEGIVPRGGDG